jgi:hypothetical protein
MSDLKNEILDELQNRTFINCNNLALPDEFYKYTHKRHSYIMAVAVLVEINRRLCIISKADNSLIDKEYQKRSLHREMNNHILNLNGTDLQAFLENERILIAKVTQLLKQ